MVSISYPVSHYYTDDDFFAAEINAKIFENKITEVLPKYKYTENIDFDIKTTPVTSEFYLTFNTKQVGGLYDAIVQTYQTMLDMLIYPSSQTEINTAKNDVSVEFSNSLKNPYNVANYAYIIEKYELPKYFFQKYNENVSRTTSLQISNTTERLFRPDNSSFLLQGDKTKLTCQIYAIAKFFRVEFFDEDFHKYKIINKGFGCYYIINDYLRACNANTNINNLTVKFDANYLADTTYLIEGIIYKKAPNYYYFKTELIIDQDTLLQKLQIANEDVWLDSTALGAYYSTEDIFWAKIYLEIYFRGNIYYSIRC